MKSIVPILFLFCICPAFAKEVALTIDDAPRGDEHIYTGIERTKRIINVLKKENIQAAFFCNSIRLSQDAGNARIQSYAEAGHIIANHTHSHPNINKVSVESYMSEIDEADKALNHFPNFKKWFRFPFLKEGSTIETRDRIRSHLKKRGYTNGYVTVDNYDYMINDFVQKALSKTVKPDLKRACEMLSDLNLYGLEEQEKLAKKHLGKSVRQVLLMHETDIEAYCLDQSIQKLRENNWKIISPTEAYEDTILRKEPNTLWLDQGRIAAFIAAKDGLKYKSKWENGREFSAELNRRGIVKDF